MALRLQQLLAYPPHLPPAVPNGFGWRGLGELTRHRQDGQRGRSRACEARPAHDGEHGVVEAARRLVNRLQVRAEVGGAVHAEEACVGHADAELVLRVVPAGGAAAAPVLAGVSVEADVLLRALVQEGEHVLPQLIAHEAQTVLALAPSRRRAPTIVQVLEFHHPLEGGFVHEACSSVGEGEEVVEEAGEILARGGNVPHGPAVEAGVVEEVLVYRLRRDLPGVLVGRILVGKARVLQTAAELREACVCVAARLPHGRREHAQLVHVLPGVDAGELYQHEAQQHVVRAGVRDAGARLARHAPLRRAAKVDEGAHVVAAVVQRPILEECVVVVVEAARHAKEVHDPDLGGARPPEALERRLHPLAPDDAAPEPLQHRVDPCGCRVLQREPPGLDGLHDRDRRPRLRH
mmetsp:Transcript_27586/g.60708  ORF Transcript_27586/g.60708 Transcript_27586/m.60708 type:complete len:406 (-) Transcript_27586:428-1645(-)